MIQIQILAFKCPPAVLAGVAISFEDIMPREFDFFFGKAVKNEQDDDPRHADLERDGANEFLTGSLLGEAFPLREVESTESSVTRFEDDLRAAFEEQSQSSSRRANVDGLPQPVQN